MLRIGSSQLPATIDLGDGAVLHVKRPTVADIQVARACATEAVAKCAEDEQTGIYRAALAEKLLQRCLESWEGIGDHDGNEILVTRDAKGNVTPETDSAIGMLLMIPGVFDKVEGALTIPIFARESEKNGLSPLPNGTSPGAKQVEAAKAEAVPIATAASNGAASAHT